MKIIGFIETSLVDWDGHVVASIFLPGCNFRCHYCHNKNAVLNPESFEEISTEYVLATIERNKDFLDGIVISGGEPSIHPDLPDLMRLIKNTGLQIKLDTNGTNPKMIQEIIDQKLVDYIAMDIKGPLNHKYSKIAGVSVKLDEIQKTMDILQESGIEYEFRTTIVPPLLSEKDVLSIIHDIRGAKKYALQQFRPDYTLNPNFSKIQPYSPDVLSALAEEAKRAINVVTVRGNV